MRFDTNKRSKLEIAAFKISKITQLINSFAPVTLVTTLSNFNDPIIQAKNKTTNKASNIKKTIVRRGSLNLVETKSITNNKTELHKFSVQSFPVAEATPAKWVPEIPFFFLIWTNSKNKTTSVKTTHWTTEEIKKNAPIVTLFKNKYEEKPEIRAVSKTTNKTLPAFGLSKAVSKASVGAVKIPKTISNQLQYNKILLFKPNE